MARILAVDDSASMRQMVGLTLRSAGHDVVSAADGDEALVMAKSGDPVDLVITDVTEGDGAEATSGSSVSVHYVGVAHSTGEEFDASYNRGEPLRFRLGIGQVIQGWDTGVQGMKVGGRRQLVIPPHLGYGDRGAGGVIKPGETLIFVVDLLAVS